MKIAIVAVGKRSLCSWCSQKRLTAAYWIASREKAALVLAMPGQRAPIAMEKCSSLSLLDGSKMA